MMWRPEYMNTWSHFYQKGADRDLCQEMLRNERVLMLV